MILFIALLFAILDLARIAQSYQGAIFQRSATLLRWFVLGQIGIVPGAGTIVWWRVKRTTTRLAWLAIVVWIVSALDFAFVAQAGVIPR